MRTNRKKKRNGKMEQRTVRVMGSGDIVNSESNIIVYCAYCAVARGKNCHEACAAFTVGFDGTHCLCGKGDFVIGRFK